jgi:PAS domain S-box-containing protein
MAVSDKNKTSFNVKEAIPLFLLFVLALIVVWIIETVLKKIPFDISAVKEIHSAHPMLWVIDLFPVLLTWLIIRSRIKWENERRELLQEISNSQKRISKYTVLANKLGKGDFSGSIVPESPGDELGESLLLLQNYLTANKRKENDETWVSEGKDMISRILRMHNRIDVMSFSVLRNLINYIQVVQGAFYIFDDDRKVLINSATYAYNRQKFMRQEFRIGEGLVGQCAFEMDYVYRTEIPDDFITISSGIIGDQKPKSLLLIPLISDEKLQGVIEFASLNERFPKLIIQFLLELGEIIARTIHNLKINQRTEKLLEESRNLTRELSENEQALKENAEEMKATQEQLRKSNEQLESKISEVQNAQGKLHWLLENASEIISIYSAKPEMTYVSPSVKRILGYTPEEMMQGKDFERLTREGANSLKQLISQAIENPGNMQSIQYSFIKKEGERIYLESTAKNLLDDPAIQGVIVNSSDITERIRAEKEERLKTRMQALSENSLDMIIRLSMSGHFHYANPVVEDYIGLEPGMLLGKSLSEIDFTTQLHDHFENSLLKVRSNPVKTNSEISIPVKMGEKLSERIMSIDAIPEFTNSELETVLFVGHDITESKRIAQEIQIKNKNIGDSINYAERIQSSLLPDIEIIRQSLPHCIIFYKPRDIVSGDFPWYFKKDGVIFIAAIDCTGHGVPGALLSFIAFFLLNDIAGKHFEKSPAEICDMLHQRVRTTLKQDVENPDSRDGMDIALCRIDTSKKEIQFTGAHRPLLFLSEGELTEYKGDRKSIGGVAPARKTEENFTNTVISYKKSDRIFIFSDGITDQLGGEGGRKYSLVRLRDKILENPGYTMPQYQMMFQDDFTAWKEGFKQLDDVLLIGIEF